MDTPHAPSLSNGGENQLSGRLSPDFLGILIGVDPDDEVKSVFIHFYDPLNALFP